MLKLIFEMLHILASTYIPPIYITSTTYILHQFAIVCALNFFFFLLAVSKI